MAQAQTLTDDDRWRIALAKDRRFDGRFVIGVHSTGIYCRPSCPARAPKRENVRFYASSAEAEAADLRACKRCAPNAVARDEAAVLAAIDEIKTSANEPGGLPRLDERHEVRAVVDVQRHVHIPAHGCDSRAGAISAYPATQGRLRGVAREEHQ